MLAVFGESIPAGEWSVLSIPAHAVPVANVFNGESDRFSYSASEKLTVRFIAPNAKVLVVDDISTNLKVASGLLLPYKMDVDLCNCGLEAIKAIQSKKYDVVFMDHRMPGMDGVETTERIRAMGENVPIIALTANAVFGMRKMFLQNGFDDYLSKPIDIVQLNMILEEWIPKEKQVNSVMENRKIKRLVPKTALVIEGLNIDKGIIFSGGVTESYYEILAAFVEDGMERKEGIKKCLDGGNLSMYVTHVHALKSAAANIGAELLSDAASALETAGQQKDLYFIETNNEFFLMMLERLLMDISGALVSFSAKDKTKNSSNTGQFRAELEKLKAALEKMDGGLINQTVDNLGKLSYNDNIKVFIRKISKHILMVEYDEANTLIESLLSQE